MRCKEGSSSTTRTHAWRSPLACRPTAFDDVSVIQPSSRVFASGGNGRIGGSLPSACGGRPRCGLDRTNRSAAAQPANTFGADPDCKASGAWGHNYSGMDTWRSITHAAAGVPSYTKEGPNAHDDPRGEPGPATRERHDCRRAATPH